jgi:hypothetical protein
MNTIAPFGVAPQTAPTVILGGVVPKTKEKKSSIQGAVEEAVPFWTMAEEQKIVALPAPSAGRQILVMKLPLDFSEIK